MLGNVRSSFGLVPLKPHAKIVNTICMYVKMERCLCGALMEGAGYLDTFSEMIVDIRWRRLVVDNDFRNFELPLQIRRAYDGLKLFRIWRPPCMVQERT